jgi:hypothetical protein
MAFFVEAHSAKLFRRTDYIFKMKDLGKVCMRKSMTGAGLRSALLPSGRFVGSPEHQRPFMGGVLN